MSLPSMNLPRALIEAVRSRQVVPFVGAGVSMGVRRGLFPSWKQLLEGLATCMLEEGVPQERVAAVQQHVTQGDYLTAAEVAFQELGAFRFNRFLRERLRVRQPPDANLAVVKALWALEPPVVLTTNYDDVLLWGREDAEPVSNDQEDELNLMDVEAAHGSPRVWYLHGTIHRLSTVVLGGSDYERLYGSADQKKPSYLHYTSALTRLREWMRARPFLYVGFSLSDPYVLKQIEHVINITRGRNIPSFALMKKGEIDRSALWPRYNIQLVEYEDHGPPLVNLLQELARTALGRAPAPQSSPGMRSPSPGLELLSFSAAPGGAPATGPASAGGVRTVSAPAAPPAAAAMPAPVPQSIPRMPAPPVPQSASSGSALQGEIPYVPRPALEEEYARILRTQKRLVLLAPEEGGTRALARRLAVQYGDRVSWLAPPNLPDCTEAEYCKALAGDGKVDSFDRLVEHLRQRAAKLGREHLVVLRYEWGPFHHLESLGKHLRRLMEEQSEVEFHVLVAGGERSAWLIHNVPKFSVFKDALRREVPDFSVADVRQMLEAVGQDGDRWAREVHEASGGLVGLVREAISGEGGLDRESIKARLARSPSVRGALQDRLREDVRQPYTGKRSCRYVIEELLAGRSVDALEALDHRLEQPEVRLYFSGLVRSDEQGRTVLRCPAVEVAARQVLALGDVRP
jgi:hypothetical protein